MARARRKAAPAEGESRVTKSSRAVRTEDEKCTVRVYLTGMDSETNKPLPNNITDTLFIKNSSVSEAAETITAAFE